MISKKTFARIKCAALFFGVIVIPLLYSYFYLGAFWDPYNKLEMVPVAVVNEDKGGVVDGTSRNLGSEMVKEMKDSGGLKWVVTDSKDAAAGVDTGRYYASITIPSNFSSDISSAQSTHKVTAQLHYSVNQKKNYIASQLLKSAMLTLENKSQSKVSKEITAQLVAKLNEVPDKLNDLESGLNQLSSGSSSLSSGANQVASGLTTLKSGAAKTADGTNTLKNGILSLDSGFTVLKSGSSKLVSGADDLDQGIGKALSGAKTLADGATSITDLNKGIDDLNSGAKELNAAATDQSTGIPALKKGISDLNSNTKTLSDNLGTYTGSVNSMIESIATYTNAASELQTVYNAIPNDEAHAQQKAQLASLIAILGDKTHRDAFTAKGTLLAKGASDLANGTALLNSNQQNLSTMQAGISGVAGGIGQLAQNETKLAQLQTGTVTLEKALEQIKDGSSQLASGSKQVWSGITSAKDGSSQLAGGATQLADATSQIKSGATSLSDGSSKLSQGASQLNNGIVTAQSSVKTAADDAKSQIASTKGLDTYASKPIHVNETDVHPVPNYGTAFAPYFMSLSLWVGALMIFFGIYLDPTERMPMLSRHSNRKFLRIGVFCLVGVGQAILLAMVLQFAMGLKINDVKAFYLSTLLVSLVFISIVEFLLVHLKDVGKFLAIAFLILQLTSCAGTFPMETVPTFFNKLYPFMPMTYSVRLFKDAISGYRNSDAGVDVAVLIGIFVVFTLLTGAMSITRKAAIKLKDNA